MWQTRRLDFTYAELKAYLATFTEEELNAPVVLVNHNDGGDVKDQTKIGGTIPENLYWDYSGGEYLESEFRTNHQADPARLAEYLAENASADAGTKFLNAKFIRLG